MSFMKNQKKLFRLPSSVSYLNTAYMSASLKSVEKAGIKAVTRKSVPHTIMGQDFFKLPKKLIKTYGKLIETEDLKNIAIIPSVSYGLANVAKNVRLSKGDEIIVVGDQFPSNIYPWMEIAQTKGAKVKIIKAPKSLKNRGERWNEKILKAINKRTAVVAMPHVHWADGTLFDLLTIRLKTRIHKALLIIDGTQSVGALPFSMLEFQPDALICAGYKWLLGPYSIGLAYYGDYFKNGTPIENNWINRLNSDDFSQLVNYQPKYRTDMSRYSVGELSNFALVPMLTKSIQQLLKWEVSEIQKYCRGISKKAIKELRSMGCFIEEEEFRSNHLFGVKLPKQIELEKLKKRLAKEQVFVSYRGDFIRVSAHLYNDAADFEKLVDSVRKEINGKQ